MTFRGIIYKNRPYRGKGDRRMAVMLGNVEVHRTSVHIFRARFDYGPASHNHQQFALALSFKPSLCATKEPLVFGQSVNFFTHFYQTPVIVAPSNVYLSVATLPTIESSQTVNEVPRLVPSHSLLSQSNVSSINHRNTVDQLHQYTLYPSSMLLRLFQLTESQSHRLAGTTS